MSATVLASEPINLLDQVMFNDPFPVYARLRAE